MHHREKAVVSWYVHCHKDSKIKLLQIFKSEHLKMSKQVVEHYLSLLWMYSNTVVFDKVFKQKNRFLKTKGFAS